MEVNQVSEIPTNVAPRVYYPWKELTEVGMSFLTDSKNSRQLVYAANKSYKKRNEVNRFKAFKEGFGFKIFRIE